MEIVPHLNFNGQCREAFETYAKVLGGEITFMGTWAEMPGADQFPPEMQKLIMHATIRLGDQMIMGADSPPDRYEKPQGLWVSIQVKDVADGERVFNELSESGWVPWREDVLTSPTVHLFCRIPRGTTPTPGPARRATNQRVPLVVAVGVGAIRQRMRRRSLVPRPGRRQ